ncbi:hypothetical protein HPP92_023867 [Vanilla planifolia]|uniref:Uncharacterized protein n=1 Tax=Vanilla planifolia TaxID=51239 RepID=A0A835PLF0_VANPL|nr:hypothetical protein HPP92_023867 [Vanilla planifolia]
MRLRRWRDLTGGTEREAQRSDTVAGVPWRWMASGMASSTAHFRHIDLMKLKVRFHNWACAFRVSSISGSPTAVVSCFL